MPEVTMVQPRADGELPASICESNSFAPGSATGPPLMTASSKRMMAAYFLLHRLYEKRHHEARDEDEQSDRILLPSRPPKLGSAGAGKRVESTYFDFLGGLQIAQLPERFGQPPSVSSASGGVAVEAVFSSETVPRG
jgi:hypothetical protein